MLTEGMYIADRYEIIGKIGTGGMSDVYKAKDHILGRNVAIKVLKQEFSEDVNFVTKFRTEAQSAAGLEHPNIVNIYDVGSENGMYFIVMEYVEGITLKTYIEKKGQLSYKEAVSIAIQVGRGIEAAHNKHIVHRDIKPQNIIISTEGKVKVTDFGIARAANNHTLHSDVMGSVHYTSPEQARNGFVDGKSDIYSLGIVMYEMVTGRVPFDGDSTVAIAIQHLQEEMVSPVSFAPRLPISMEKVIMKCTQKNPDRRYESISDLLVDLKKVLISPDDDFVTIVPAGQDKTRMVKRDEVDVILKETNEAYYRKQDEDTELDEEEDEEGGFLNPKMEKAVTIMGIVAAVIIVIIIVVILGSLLGWFRFGGGKNKDKDNDVPPIENNIDEEEDQEDENLVTMISVLGKTQEEAEAELRERNLGIRVVGNTASDEYEVGQIVTQNVKQGDKVPKNTTIEVTICSGPGEFEAPSVVGQDEERAAGMIENMGLVPKRDFAYSDTVPQGKVISQTPEGGTPVKKGDTVTYMVSQGTELVKVPDVTGKSESEARETLTNAGFNNVTSTSEYDDTVAEGLVIRQSFGGEYKELGTTISLVISMGKQTRYYSFRGTYNKPSVNGVDPAMIKASTIELGMAESDESITPNVVDNGSSISVSASNIANYTSGVLLIEWSWTEKVPVSNEDGTVTEKEETKTKTEEYNVTFQQQ